MMDDIHKYYNEKIDDLINHNKSQFLCVKNSIALHIKNQFQNKITCDEQLSNLEYYIYSLFLNEEKKYLSSVSRERKEEFSFNAVNNIINILLKTSDVKDIIYIGGKILPYLLIDQNSFDKYSGIDLYVLKSNASKLRDILKNHYDLNDDCDSLDYINEDYGFEFYLGNIPVRVGIINYKKNNVEIRSFDRCNVDKSFTLIRILDTNQSLITSETDKYRYINLFYNDVLMISDDKDNDKKNHNRTSNNHHANIQVHKYNFNEVNFNFNKDELVSELYSNRKESEELKIEYSKKQVGFVRNYLMIFIISMLIILCTLVMIMGR